MTITLTNANGDSMVIEPDIIRGSVETATSDFQYIAKAFEKTGERFLDTGGLEVEAVYPNKEVTHAAIRAFVEGGRK